MRKALDFIKGGNNWSGTEVLDALKTAYDLPQADGDMARTFVIATDGFVTVEKECFEMIRKNNDKANFFAFGIGSSVNRYLIEGMAFAGNGEPMIVTNEKDATAQAERFRSYINTPVLTHIKFKTNGFNAYDIEPMTVPDMMSERPIMIFGKYKGTPSGSITLSGKVGRKPYKQTFDLSKATADSSNSALRYLWARERIKYLDYQVENQDDASAKKILELGLKYNLMTNYTSFVAIDEEIVNKEGKQVSVKQAVPLPEGVSDYAVGHDAGAVSNRMVSMKENYVTLAAEEEIVEEEIVEEEIFVVVENEPEFPGGMDSLMAFLARNIVYPKTAKENGIQGKVFLTFCVEKDGSISNIKVLRDIGGGCGAEAVRVVKMMPKWTPGKQRGKAVRVQYNLPIQFILDE